jgi:sortase (surface protein transpeptidase)
MTRQSPTTIRRQRRRPLWPAALAVVVGLLLIHAGLERSVAPTPQPPQRALPAAVLRAEHEPTALRSSEHPRERKRPRPPKPVARPTRLVVPSIGVSTPIIRVGLLADHTLQVPARFDVTGWYRYGSRPGEPGPAVIAGHVDSVDGPAVFYRIGSLRRGARIKIRRADGSWARFVVEGLERRSKEAFPTRRVYGRTPRPTLRLITCGGAFDQATGHYVDNTIVYATEV